MTQQVFVHVGAPKTGTTYLQNLLWRNREALRTKGLLYPGSVAHAHVLATLDLRNIGFKGYRNPDRAGAWKRLVDEIKGYDGNAVIDHELLAGAGEKHVDRALRDLDFADVHVVYTARDMARQLPAAWQSWVRNRGVESFADWLHAVHNPKPAPEDAGRLFWNLHGTVETLRRWTRNIPADRVHVITVPPSGSDPNLLWQRFAGVLGVEPTGYRTDFGKANNSLAAAEVTALRRLNVAIGGDSFPWTVYDRVVKHYLAWQLSERHGEPIALPPAEHEWAAEYADKTIAAIAEAGYAVIGDLDELKPGPPRPGVDPDSVVAVQQADAAVAGMAALVQLMAKDEKGVLDTRRELQAARRALREHRELPPRERIKRCAVELSEQVGWLGTARRGYRSLRRG